MVGLVQPHDLPHLSVHLQELPSVPFNHSEEVSDCPQVVCSCLALVLLLALRSDCQVFPSLLYRSDLILCLVLPRFE